MANDSVKMPADGSGTERRETDGNGEVASRRDWHADGAQNAGESGGGAYPDPGTTDEDDGFQGGQSEQAYFGKGQLGDKDVSDSSNAVSSEG